MNFDLSTEQSLLRESVARFVAAEYGFEHRRKLMQSEEGFARGCWRQFAAMGLLGLSLPEDVGGLGCSAIETMLVMEQLGRGMVLEPYVPTAVLGARLLDRCASPAQREALLPSLIGGELMLALAHEEPECRDLPALPSTRARREGSGYRLDGYKIMALNAAAADWLFVSARIEETGELGLFLLPTSLPGLEILPYALVCGRRAGDLRLDGLRCGAETLLAHGAAAAEALDEALDRAQLAIMAEALGAIEACLDQTAEYVKGRTQFGQPIGKFQALQHLMAEMFVDAQDARSILYQALARIDAAPAARRRAVSAARIVIGEAGRRVASQGLQMHGGYGTTDEYAISHHYRQLFVLERLFGDVDFHLHRLSSDGPAV
jgi:alkylation response protein AidB-like acyl-CoA dehydrogenase